MNAEFVNPFISALKNVVKTMAQTDLNAGKPVKKTNTIACGEVSSLISMNGPQLKGSMSISFEESLALEIMSKMLGEKPECINDEVADMVGEITNMVCGGAKNDLIDLGYEFDMASPKVVSGKDHQLEHQQDGRHMILPFSSQSGTAYLEICFQG